MFKVNAPNMIRPMYINRKELEELCKYVLVNEYTKTERENNIRNYLNHYTLEQNVKNGSARILRELGYKVVNVG